MREEIKEILKEMVLARYKVTLFDSKKNERYLVSMFAPCMSAAAARAKEELAKRIGDDIKYVAVRNIEASIC